MKWRLTTDDVANGRALLLAAMAPEAPRAKLEEFYEWVEANVLISIGPVRETYDKLYAMRESSRALKLYDRTLVNYDPLMSMIRFGIRCLVILVALGGVVYLFKAIVK